MGLENDGVKAKRCALTVVLTLYVAWDGLVLLNITCAGNG